MEEISLEQAALWAGGQLGGNNTDISISGISTDSRTIEKGQLFLPLRGESFDGHDYIDMALGRGASGFISSIEIPLKFRDIPHIRVEDTLRAYQQIARCYRKSIGCRVVAITGSNGKTTTKDMIAGILSYRFKIASSEKNYNNEIGVPQTILKMDRNAEILVAELAMRGRGQILELARIVEPDIGVITNIGEAHYELLGSYEAIAEAKCELLGEINPEGIAVLNADSQWFDFCVKRATCEIISFGIENPAHVRLVNKRNLGLEGYDLEVEIRGNIHGMHLPRPGIHNIYNALSAVAVALSLGMPEEEIAKGMAQLKSSDKRMEILETPMGVKVINDTYNASPSSTMRAMEMLGELDCPGRKIAVLADMLELGDIEIEEHRKTGAFAMQKGMDMLFTLGDLGKEIAEGAKAVGINNKRISVWQNRRDLTAELISTVKPGDVVLVKGSRKMRMEEIVSGIISG